MKSDLSSLNLNDPDSWLILSIFTIFLLCSYYSLFVCLVHTHRQNRLLENEE